MHHYSWQCPYATGMAKPAPTTAATQTSMHHHASADPLLPWFPPCPCNGATAVESGLGCTAVRRTCAHHPEDRNVVCPFLLLLLLLLPLKFSINNELGLGLRFGLGLRWPLLIWTMLGPQVWLLQLPVFTGKTRRSTNSTLFNSQSSIEKFHFSVFFSV